MPWNWSWGFWLVLLAVNQALIACNFAAHVFAHNGASQDSIARTGKQDTDARDRSIQVFTRGLAAAVAEETTMATETIWQPGSIGDFGASASWSNGVPGSVQNLIGIADGTSQVSMTINVDRTGGSWPFELKRTPDFFGDIGAPGSPLIWDGEPSGKSATIRGSGTTNLQPISGNNSDIIIDAAGGTVNLDGEIFALMIKNGTVNCAATTFFGDYVIVDGVAVILNVDAGSAGNSIDNLILKNGVVNNDRPTSAAAGSIQVSGGELNQTGLIDSAITIIVTAGVMNYAPSSDPSSDAPDLIVMGGVFDVSGFGGAIPFGRVIIGPNGDVKGTIIEGVGQFADYDLREDYP